MMTNDPAASSRFMPGLQAVGGMDWLREDYARGFTRVVGAAVAGSSGQGCFG